MGMGRFGDLSEVRRECRAQIERALAWGIDVTHLAPHLTAITLRAEFFGVYLGMGARGNRSISLRPPSRTNWRGKYQMTHERDRVRRGGLAACRGGLPELRSSHRQDDHAA